MPPQHEPSLDWLVGSADGKQLERAGYKVESFADLRARFIEPARKTDRPISRESPAVGLFALFDAHPRVAVTGVPTGRTGDLQDLYGYLVDPAWRRGVALKIYADRPLEQLRAENLSDPELGYAWTLERLQFIAARASRREMEPGLPPLTPIEYLLLNAMRAAELSPVAQYGVGPFRVDFAFPDIQLSVEADGREWHDPERDRRRDERLRHLGWSVVHFTGSEIVRDAELCAAAVAERRGELLASVQYTPTQPDADRQSRGTWWHRLWVWLAARLLGKGTSEPGESFEQSPAITLPPLSLGGLVLDESQSRAVRAGGSVVQVLAPAGSGKTTVLVARAAELISRGVPANRILCCTFNRAVQADLAMRLAEAGADQVVTKTFAGIGRAILDDNGLLRAKIGSIGYSQWKYLAGQAKSALPDGVWLEPEIAAERINKFKLVDLATPEEARASLRSASQPIARDATAVELYHLYEELLEHDDRLDFDDLIMRSLRLLIDREEVRREWQGKYLSVLVDEYQDIEPAQEKLIQILAAPHDSLFCVGDEDQCIYTWRRASVRHIVELDRKYPSLERHALKINYRCPPQVTEGSRLMIESNKDRFAKEILPAASAPQGCVEITAFGPKGNQPLHAAQLLEGTDAQETVVLARTKASLRSVAVECAKRGIRFKAGDFVLDKNGPNRTLAAYLGLLANQEAATVEDTKRVFRRPNRYLPDNAAQELVHRLRSGLSFSEALTGLGGGEEWREKALCAAGTLFDRLANIGDAFQLIEAVRSEGGVDGYYAAAQKLTAHDQSSIDALDAAQQNAKGLTVGDYAERFARESDLIGKFRSDDGVELTTIHGAKGREWKWVIVIDADDNTMPHRRTIDSAPDEDAAAAAIEDERRLTYVAFTRTKQRLTVLHGGTRSRFLKEAAFRDALTTQIGFEQPEPPISPRNVPAQTTLRAPNRLRSTRA